MASPYSPPTTTSSAPKMLTLENVLELGWKICGMKRPDTMEPPGGYQYKPLENQLQNECSSTYVTPVSICAARLGGSRREVGRSRRKPRARTTSRSKWRTSCATHVALLPPLGGTWVARGGGGVADGRPSAIRHTPHASDGHVLHGESGSGTFRRDAQPGRRAARCRALS